MDISKYRVPPEKLRWSCDPDQFRFDCTWELSPLQEFIGQSRAIKAVEFGLEVNRPGYNIFVTGLTGTGRASVIRAYLQKLVATKEAEGAQYRPDDWCYVHNFTDADRPQVIRLPKGRGRTLAGQMEVLLQGLKAEVAKAFAGEEYLGQRKEIMEQGQSQQQSLFQELQKMSTEKGFAVQFSPMGVVAVPLIEGKPATQAEYLALDEGTRGGLEARRVELMQEVEAVVEKARSVEKETMDQVRELDQRIGEYAIARLFGEMLRGYADFPEVTRYLQEVRDFTLKNIDLFREEEPKGPSAPPALQLLRERDPLLAFKVNLFVDNSETVGPPIVMETNPTYGNMFGKIERRSMMGAYFTDHTMLRPGAVSLANGGYLVLNARDVLTNPGVWEGLKRVIKNKELRLEDPLEQFGLLVPHGLRPQPIPTEVKFILTSDNLLYHLLSSFDEDFWEIFKVKADFDYLIGRDQESMEAYASFISSCCDAEELLHFNRSGVAKVLEYGARLVADQGKLSSRFGQIKDVLIEADYWARKLGGEAVTAEHVQRAIQEKIYRSNLVAERIRGLIAEGTIMVDTEGEVVGQVNGLSVYQLGDITLGRPSRITAKTFMGRGGVINIEREAQLSGKTHDKGVLILSGYLGWQYAQDKPLSLSASLCFEQSYEGVEGDSASSTELYAILSSLAGLPVKQGLAVTGSVSQKGEIQPIGGVNQKIEGFFDVCKEKGLTGEQGVSIPHQNMKNLMLREDVVEAVAHERFHIFSIRTIDEGMELLTGVPAGERQEDGTYPENTVNYLVDKRLRELAEGIRGFHAERGEKDEKKDA